MENKNRTSAVPLSPEAYCSLSEEAKNLELLMSVSRMHHLIYEILSAPACAVPALQDNVGPADQERNLRPRPGEDNRRKEQRHVDNE